MLSEYLKESELIFARCASPPGLQGVLWLNSTRFLDSDCESEKHSHMWEKYFKGMGRNK